MILSGRRTILCLLLLLTPVITLQSQSTVDKAATSIISGKITVGGKGVAGVVVGLAISDQYRSNFRPTRFRSTTDDEGNYRITKVPPGTYEVIAASPAFVPTEFRKSLVVGKNETLENIDITLNRGGVITGTVTDADGRPVIEEAVYVNAVTAQQTPYFRDIRTDDRGVYRAYGVPAGRYKVYAGKVANSNAGQQRTEGVHQLTYHPNAADPNAATVIDVSEGTEAINVDITLRGPARTYSARGRIINSDTDQPLPKMRVEVRVFFQYGHTSRENAGESTKDGEFTVENLAPGKYAVYTARSSNSEWRSEIVPFEVTDRDVEGLLIKSYKGASVSGVVILEGTNDAKVRENMLAGRIYIINVEGNRAPLTSPATLNPDGSFRITGLPAGRLTFFLQAPEPFRLIRLERHGMAQPRGLEIKEREQITNLQIVVGHAKEAIRGTVRLPPDWALPIPIRFRAVVRRIEDVQGSFPSIVDTDSRGTFRVDGLIPGTYEIAVNALMNVPPGQLSPIPPTKQTVIVTRGAVSDVTITMQMPTPQGP